MTHTDAPHTAQADVDVDANASGPSAPTAAAPEPLGATEARVLGTLMEKARTVPDSYPLSLQALLTGCNQKTARDPVMELTEADVTAALDALRARSLVLESSGARVPRYAHNLMRGLGVPEQSAVQGLSDLLPLTHAETLRKLKAWKRRGWNCARACA